MVSNVTGLTPPLQLAELYCVFERREEKIYHWKFFYYRSSEFAFGSLRDCRFCPPPQKKNPSLHTLGLKTSQGSSECPDNLFGGSMPVKAH